MERHLASKYSINFNYCEHLWLDAISKGVSEVFRHICWGLVQAPLRGKNAACNPYTAVTSQ